MRCWTRTPVYKRSFDAHVSLSSRILLACALRSDNEGFHSTKYIVQKYWTMVGTLGLASAAVGSDSRDGKLTQFPDANDDGENGELADVPIISQVDDHATLCQDSNAICEWFCLSNYVILQNAHTFFSLDWAIRTILQSRTTHWQSRMWPRYRASCWGDWCFSVPSWTLNMIDMVGKHENSPTLEEHPNINLMVAREPLSSQVALQSEHDCGKCPSSWVQAKWQYVRE